MSDSDPVVPSIADNPAQSSARRGNKGKDIIGRVCTGRPIPMTHIRCKRKMNDMEPLLCEKCGKTGSAGATYCGACGGKLFASHVTQTATEQRFAGNVQHRADRKSRIKLACLCAPLFGLIIFGGVAGMIGMAIGWVLGLPETFALPFYPLGAVAGTIFTAWVLVSDKTTQWRTKLDGREKKLR